MPPRARKTIVFLGLAASLLSPLGCSSAKPAESITLATTTSTQDTGLLDLLVPTFRAQTGIEVKVVAVGTGQALELGRRGDADVLLVHDPASEEGFMAEGYGQERRAVMYNDFVLVGPPDNPAGVKGLDTVVKAFARIAERKKPFLSRGDESGTHQKELAIWRRAGIEPAGDWYVRAGTGMGALLRMADQKQAYTLSDRGTYLAQHGGMVLEILSEADPLLANPYHVIVISPEKHPHVHRRGAKKFADFLVSPQTQQMIADFGNDRYGQPLFFPGAPIAE